MKIHTKRLISIILLLVFVLSISACGGENERKVSSSSQKNVGTLKVAWFPATIKAALTSTAYSLGYFDEEGVTVECETLQNAADAITAVKLGKVDISPVGITQQLQFISEGSDLVIFGGSAQEGGAVVTKPENAERFSDLKNWKDANWATGRSFTGDFVIRNQLRKYGIIPGEDIIMSDLADNTPIIQAVAKGTADVGYITSDGVSIAKSMGLTVGIRVGDLSPYYPCCRQTANGEAIKNKKEAFVAYQRALIRAYKVIQSDHEKAIEVMEELTGQSREYVESGLYGKYASRYNPSPATKKVAEFYGFLKQEGVIRNESFKIEDNINVSIFKEALEDILDRYPDDKDYLALKAFSDEND
ncbi:ABC transporter substrate-binding protein [Ruminiclostridium herbifermentans]|uniref:ABC transporter substrate-binding protein n=1 Tax=Ruminiclostridium herbifermentans TaxID=2488810 RepID=A0A4U7JIW5_9FIRM|nr:ABC transporter substrate-binding protein [Ruminiclostridium herbifermentans]QNU68602.1 ABC transporter substrate-binding protein [Ruminiclostridium herbifermentans]